MRRIHNDTGRMNKITPRRRIRPYLLLLVAGCIWAIAGHAQGPWKFRSTEYAGILTGEKNTYPQFQTINGLYKRSWFLGVGTGQDYYRYRSVPLFLSVTKDLMGGRNGLFLGLDAGTNFPWYKRSAPLYGYVAGSDFQAGAYWSAGLGYRFRLSAHGRTALLLTAGYSFKELKEEYKYVIPPCPIGGYCPLQVPSDRYDYKNDRLTLKAGISF
ncbi:MAG TPA: hypothetical protein VK563_23885 [Puia sp.]|nr:hypothetical protein [Puia sp.]